MLPVVSPFLQLSFRKLPTMGKQSVTSADGSGFLSGLGPAPRLLLWIMNFSVLEVGARRESFFIASRGLVMQESCLSLSFSIGRAVG